MSSIEAAGVLMFTLARRNWRCASLLDYTSSVTGEEKGRKLGLLGATPTKTKLNQRTREICRTNTRFRMAGLVMLYNVP